MAGPAASFYFNPGASYDALPDDWVRFTLMVNPVVRAPEFLMGVLAARLHQLKLVSPRFVLRFLPVAVVFAAWVLLQPALGFPRVFISNGLLAPTWIAIILSLSHGRPAWLHHLLSRRWLVTLGEASFGIYILQAPVAALVLGLYKGPGHLALFLVLLPVLATLSFWYFEMPVRRLLRGRKAETRVAIPVAATN
jgi:peptidoglycan/LPS O-acetylase OafA/YrhL